MYENITTVEGKEQHFEINPGHPGWVILKTLKMVQIASMLGSQYWGLELEG